MVTIFDVANYAGVSKSTVSLVLNNSPLVKASTREKVQEAIKKLQYVPNYNARGLSARTTGCLGIVIMTERTPYISYDFDHHTGMCSYNISSGIISGLVDSDYGVIMEHFCSVDNPGELPEIVRNRRVDGAFLVGSPYDRGMIDKLREMKFPFVVVGVDSHEDGVDTVKADPGDGVEIGLRHLAQAGYGSDIAFVNCPSVFRSADVRERRLWETAGELGIPLRTDWVVRCESNTGDGGYRAFCEFWEKGNRPRAVITANGAIALGVMRMLYERGVRVPDDVSIMSYEDNSLSGYCSPPLTTVNIHKELMGTTAAKCMLKRLKEPDAPIREIVIPADLVVRGSVIKRGEQSGQ